MRGSLARRSVPSGRVTPSVAGSSPGMVTSRSGRGDPQRTWPPVPPVRGGSMAGAFNAREGVGSSIRCLRYGLLGLERGPLGRRHGHAAGRPGEVRLRTAYRGTGLWQPSVHSDVAF
jgi:hypothetical protein